MPTKYKGAEECISAEDTRLVVEALNEHIMNQTRRGAYIVDIQSTVRTRDAIKKVWKRASLEHDDVCFIVNAGVR